LLFFFLRPSSHSPFSTNTTTFQCVEIYEVPSRQDKDLPLLYDTSPQSKHPPSHFTRIFHLARTLLSQDGLQLSYEFWHSFFARFRSSYTCLLPSKRVPDLPIIRRKPPPFANKIQPMSSLNINPLCYIASNIEKCSRGFPYPEEQSFQPLPSSHRPTPRKVPFWYSLRFPEDLLSPVSHAPFGSLYFPLLREESAFLTPRSHRRKSLSPDTPQNTSFRNRAFLLLVQFSFHTRIFSPLAPRLSPTSDHPLILTFDAATSRGDSGTFFPSVFPRRPSFPMPQTIFSPKEIHIVDRHS